MALKATTDAGEIDRALDAAVAADPVRNTVLGSVRAVPGDRWAAWDATRVAARSAPTMPVALSTEWADVGPLAEALAALPDLAGLGGRTDTVAALVDVLALEPTRRMDERLYRLDDLIEPAGVPGCGRPTTSADADLLVGWYDDFLAEAFGALPAGHDSVAVVRRAVDGTTPPLVWRDDAGRPVAMAACRSSGGGVHRVGPVYTPPALRGHGFGSAVTAAVSRGTLEAGAVPVLYTDLANPTSNAIYQRLGYRAVADRASVAFS